MFYKKKAEQNNLQVSKMQCGITCTQNSEINTMLRKADHTIMKYHFLF